LTNASAKSTAYVPQSNSERMFGAPTLMRKNTAARIRQNIITVLTLLREMLNAKPPLKKEHGSQLIPARRNEIPTAISRTRGARYPFKRNFTFASVPESNSENTSGLPSLTLMQRYCMTRQAVKLLYTTARDGRREAIVDEGARISMDTGAKKPDHLIDL